MAYTFYIKEANSVIYLELETFRSNSNLVLGRACT